MNTQDISGPYTVISVESRKGGVGKTTAALVLANMLLERGYSVLLIDADITGTNTGRAVRESPIWRHRTNVAILKQEAGNDRREDEVLLCLFEDFMSGKQLKTTLRQLFPKNGSNSAFAVIGSGLAESEKTSQHSPSVLFDELHSYWFRVFLEELCKNFASVTKDSDPDPHVVIVIDNSPGFTGIAPALHEWLTDLGPVRGKFLTITSPDTQDLAACRSSVNAIHRRLQQKCKVAAWTKNARNEDMEQAPLDDSEYKFLVRLIEGKDPHQNDNPLCYYLAIVAGSSPHEVVPVSQYQGMIINKVIPLLMSSSTEWSVDSLFHEESPARELLFSEGINRRRLVQYDEYLELQFSQHLLRPADTTPQFQEHAIHRLQELESKLPRGISAPVRLREGLIEPPEVERTLMKCRRALLVLQNYIERSIKILDESQLDFVSRLVRPEWLPRQFLESLRGAFINAVAKSRDLPLYRGSTDIPLRPTPERYEVLARLAQMARRDTFGFRFQHNPAFINSILIVAGLALADFFHKDDWTEGFIQDLLHIADSQTEEFANLAESDKSSGPSAFLMRKSSMPSQGVFDLALYTTASPIRFKRDVFALIYPTLCQAQSRFLDLEADVRLLGWVLEEAVRIGVHSRRAEIYLPDLRALLRPVIEQKSLPHSHARETTRRIIRGASYLQRFGEPLEDILNRWQFR